jgi:hypothetical protein
MKHDKEYFGNLFVLISSFVAIFLTVFQLQTPPLGDFMNHLGRIYVSENYGQVDIFEKYYSPTPGFSPYLAMDVPVRVMSGLVGIDLAGRLFAALAVALPILAVAVLSGVLWRRLSIWPTTAALFSFNHTVMGNGELPYVFALSFGILALAAWIAAADLGWRSRFAIFVPTGLLLIAMHLLVFGYYMMLVLAFELGRVAFWKAEIWREGKWRAWLRSLCLTGATFLPALSLLLLVGHRDAGMDFVRWGDLSDHLWCFLAPVLYSVPDQRLAGGQILPLLLLFGFLLVLGIGLAGRTLRFHPALRGPVILTAMIAAVFPLGMMGVTDLAYRLPTLLTFLLAAAVCPVDCAPWRRRLVAVVVLVAAIGTRLATAIPPLLEGDRDITEMRAAAHNLIKRGGRVLPVMVGVQPYSTMLPLAAIWHAGALLTIDEDAFYPLLFSTLSLTVRPEYKAMTAPASIPVPLAILGTPTDASHSVILGQPDYWGNWRKDFDYILLYHMGAGTTLNPSVATLLWQGRALALYQIMHP